MNPIATALASNKPREKSGSQTSARYDYQRHIAILKIIELQENGKDYCVILDYFDDIIILDSPVDPQYLLFIQVKSKSGGRWTINQICKAKKGAAPPASIIGRMYLNMDTFYPINAEAIFLTNAGFKFKLSSENETSDDDIIVDASELHDDEKEKVANILASDFPLPRKIKWENVTRFEKSSLGLVDQSMMVKGALVDLLESYTLAGSAPVAAIYRTLFENISIKSGISENIECFTDIVAKKGFKKSEFIALLDRALNGSQFLQSWSMIEAELSVSLAPLEVVRLKTAAIRYLGNRAKGEPVETLLSKELRAAGESLQSSLGGCTSILEAAELLKGAVQGPHLADVPAQTFAAAALVEAFEELLH